jgi:thiol-disulfide isomerase/thioredoxin
MRPKEPTDLIGKPAPPFAADLLSGKKFNPADHKGKNVVILDFWATWCGPCVVALPILADIAKEYKDRGVVVIPVNVGDTTATIQQFLETKGLDLEVGLDESGKAGMLYHVNGIPQTVMIGKDGIVADVHVGFGRNMGVLLREEIESLLAGQPINRQAQNGGPPR